MELSDDNYYLIMFFLLGIFAGMFLGAGLAFHTDEKTVQHYWLNDQVLAFKVKDLNRQLAICQREKE